MTAVHTPSNSSQQPFRSHLLPATDRLSKLPYWLLAALILAVIAFGVILSNEKTRIILIALRQGIWTSISVSIIAYGLAVLGGLFWMLLRVSPSRILQEISSFFVEILRGIPMLVLLYYISFVGAPALIAVLNWLGQPLIAAQLMEAVNVRQVNFTTRAILALAIGYGAFISEIFRAGIESIEKHQTEAAQTEGASYWQIMRFILLPQAVRNVLPALGNEFIAMLKDSALVSVLGVQDITQLGRVYAASTFNFFGTYSIAAMLYLVMTLGLSLLVRWTERNLKL